MPSRLLPNSKRSTCQETWRVMVPTPFLCTRKPQSGPHGCHTRLPERLPTPNRQKGSDTHCRADMALTSRQPYSWAEPRRTRPRTRVAAPRGGSPSHGVRWGSSQVGKLHPPPIMRPPVSCRYLRCAMYCKASCEPRTRTRRVATWQGSRPARRRWTPPQIFPVWGGGDSAGPIGQRVS